MTSSTNTELIAAPDTFAAGFQAAQQQAIALCKEMVERPPGFGGRWEGYGKSMTQRTGEECAQAIEGMKP